MTYWLSSDYVGNNLKILIKVDFVKKKRQILKDEYLNSKQLWTFKYFLFWNKVFLLNLVFSGFLFCNLVAFLFF